MLEDQSNFFIKEWIWHEIVRLLKISGRESEIIRYIMTGEPDKCIASRLGISTHTVRTHVERLYTKLNVNSRAQLIARIFAEYVHLDASNINDKL
jgi:DNA-binding CsgD family transcriptional regulator